MTFSSLLSIRSHPVRVRGLKDKEVIVLLKKDTVAPRAGAWIERMLITLPLIVLWVAPRAGAWIES